MITRTSSRLRQVIDIKAAAIAGLFSGLVFFGLNILLSQIAVGSSWIYTRVIAAIVMGESVLPPPSTFELDIFLVSLLIHLGVSLILAFLIDLAIYRWGILFGFIGGGLLGLALYFINFYALSYFFPWFYSFRSWIIVASHITFGALAGGIYELLEVEEYVQVGGEKEGLDG